jgi:hypothetical protein
MKIKNLKLSLKIGIGDWELGRQVFMGLVVKPRRQID